MFAKLFLTHPRAVDESYVEHAFSAGRFAARLMQAGAAAAVHAVIPGLFVKTASKIVAELYEATRDRER